MLSLTKKALEEFDNQHDFERMCADILNALGYKNVVPIAPRGGGDGGRDITFTTETEGKGLACVTLRRDSDKKFNEDFGQRNKGEFEKYFFFTNQYLTADQKKRYIRHCLDALDAELIPYDIEALRSLLDSGFKSIRKRYLHIDDDKSEEIRKHISNWLKYPATLSSANYQERASIAEFKLTQPVHREIYYYINDFDDSELQEVPIFGQTLHSYKEQYYNFCLSATDLTIKCRNVISTQTQTTFQFFHGWRIFFNYFLFREFGNSEQEAQQAVSVNYGITYEDCERVFNLLRNTREIAIEIDRINRQWKEINQIMSTLEDEINLADA